MFMRSRASVAQVLSALLLLLSGSSFGQAIIPDTPAGRTLEAWLDAFNSGDRAKIEAYVRAIHPTQSVDGMLMFRTQTGGFDLLGVETSAPLFLTFRVKEKTSPVVGIGTLKMKDGQPATVEQFSLQVLPAGAVVEDIRLDATYRRRVINGVSAKLREFYVFPDTAEKMAAAIGARDAAGEYNGVTDGISFAALLTEHLRAVSNDRHLRVSYRPFRLSTEPTSPDATAAAVRRTQRINCGFEKLEILNGNIGYLKFNFFADPATCGPTATAAMNFLAHSEAVIFDLRDNIGGDPKMVALISSYLFDQPTHLNDIYDRKENTTTQYWTLPYVPGPRLTDRPAYVLTSKTTFSGAEEFSYNLKNLKRVTIVGEQTGGGAHPQSSRIADEHFIVAVPFARAINPISKTNWEGAGVEPDVQASSSEALTVATRLATEKIQANRSERQ